MFIRFAIQLCWYFDSPTQLLKLTDWLDVNKPYLANKDQQTLAQINYRTTFLHKSLSQNMFSNVSFRNWESACVEWKLYFKQKQMNCSLIQRYCQRLTNKKIKIQNHLRANQQQTTHHCQHYFQKIAKTVLSKWLTQKKPISHLFMTGLVCGEIFLFYRLFACFMKASFWGLFRT